MKKTLCFLFIVSIFLTFASCRDNPNNNLTSIPNYSGEFAIDENLSFRTEKNIYSKKNTIIKYTITNIGTMENEIPVEEFQLHKYDDGKWKFVTFKYAEFNFLLQVLSPNESTDGEICLEKFFDLPLDIGKYRLVIGQAVSNTFEVK